MKSVGRGADMNLGLSPMPSGILHDNDVKSLKAFGVKIAETFKTNFAERASIKASDVRGQNLKNSGHSLFWIKTAIATGRQMME